MEMTEHFFLYKAVITAKTETEKDEVLKNNGINTLRRGKEYVLSSWNITKIISYNYIYIHNAINEIPRC